MKKSNFITVIIFFTLLLTSIGTYASNTEAKKKQKPKAVLKKLEQANSYFAKKYPDVEIVTGSAVMEYREFPSNYWAGAVYYVGLMALNSIHPQEEYYEQAVKWGESHNWMLNSYKVGEPVAHSRNANNHCAGQTYLELYQIDPKPQRIAIIRESLTRVVETPEANKDWDWVDALFMAMPTFAKLGVIDKDEKYFDKMHEMYLASKNEIGGGLYNAEDGLWWRDADFAPPYKEPNGEDCYWSRGNGWVYAALVRVLEVLPKDNKYREEYLKTYKEMSEALLKVQRTDGFWNVSLHDPTHFGGKELTGTAMFTYGFAWGLNNKVLEESKYADAMLKAWSGLSECVHKDGYLGYVQGSGKEPKDGQPVTYDSEPDLQDYGLGCFLLGGSEVYKYLMNNRN
jgi:unsaturated rhamnogalacturonyl hydrolase